MKMNVILKTMAVVAIGVFTLTWQMSGQISTLTPAQLAARQAQLEQNIQLIMPPPISPAVQKKIQARKATLAKASPMNGGSPMAPNTPQTPIGQNYTVVDLRTLGGDMSSAFGINDNTQIVGSSDTSDYNSHAFLWSNGSMQDLGTLGGYDSYAYGINNKGQVIGYAATSGNYYHAFLWSNGSMQDLGTLGGYDSYARAINDKGQVVGYAATSSGNYHAFLWSNGSMQDLGTLGGNYSEAYGINNNGQVVGYASTNASSYDHAFLWSNGSMQNLGTLGGSYSDAYSINDNGQVVGQTATSDGSYHAFLWSNGSMQDLGTLAYNNSYAISINNNSQVVGYASTGGNGGPFLYSGNTIQDLSSLIIPASSGIGIVTRSINSSGQIAGYEINSPGHAVLLSPIPVGVVQAISNTVPVQPIYGDLTKQSGKDSLVVITHGWTSRELYPLSPPNPAWVDDMSNNITGYLINHSMNNWQVAGYKWIQDSWTLLPDSALHNATQEGIALGNIISSQGWGHVHLIAHSAGSELISTAAQWIKVFSPSTVVQCTFLDAYVGINYAGVSDYGAGTDWSDSYFSRDLETSPGGEAHPLTEGPLNNSFNVDVTQLDPTKIVYNEFSSSGSLGSCYTTKSTHGWPITLYENSITSPSGYAGYGFPLSFEGGNYGQGQYSKGNTPPVILGTPDPICNGNATDSTTPAYVGPAINFSGLPTQQSSTGVIVVNGVRFSLTTDSPAWLASFITLTNPADLVSFDAEFTSAVGAQGILSVYWDTNLIGSVDERVTIPGLSHYTFSFPSAKDNLVHMLGFRLDPFTNISSTISITNVVMGYAGVSQPFSLAITTNKVFGLPVMKLAGQPGFNYTVQASTNLTSTNWMNIAVLANTNGAVQFIDPDSVNYSMRFYRAVAPQ